MNWSDIPPNTFEEIKPYVDTSMQKSANFSNKFTMLPQSGSYSDVVKAHNIVQINEQSLVQPNKPTEQSTEQIKEQIKEQVKEQIKEQIKGNDNKRQDKSNSNSRKKNYCYTCKPRGKVLKHIICKDEERGVVFHYDMHKRPLILITPVKHYNTIYDIPDIEVNNIFKAIRVFCEQWNIVDYQISYNNGKWQTHTHFHIKIKISEKIINRLRRDHFLRLKLQQNYK